MEKLLQYALTGLAAGSLYALVALGVVLIYRSTRVLNFAHGDIATLATFVSFSLLSKGYSFPLALTVSLTCFVPVKVSSSRAVPVTKYVPGIVNVCAANE